MSILYDIIYSWSLEEGNVSSNEEIDKWLSDRAHNLRVKINKVAFSYKGFWYYDEKKGYIRNKNNSFFQLAGCQEIEDDKIVSEQPIILQHEIGYLGIICKRIGGVLNFMMQAKIEPGNVNIIQLSPTIQATKSNFTRMHGGKSPAYLEYFIHSAKHQIISDQIQSEQSSRFDKKRNRNIIIYVEDEVEQIDSHKWMTLGQIKRLMKRDNVVNMDTRTVLSSFPFFKSGLEDGELEKIEELFCDKALFRSMFMCDTSNMLSQVFNKINDFKMFWNAHNRLVPLRSLKSWDMGKKEIVCKTPHDFKVIYCYIEIEGREVQYWEQPLVEANGMLVLGLFTTVENGVRKFLVKVRHEIGCFDGAELGPSIQLEPTNPRTELNSVEELFLEKMEKKERVLKNVILSEEGGRFYHEQNKNVILEVEPDEVDFVSGEYFWVEYYTLNRMIQFYNCVNIQLRNLLAILDI